MEKQSAQYFFTDGPYWEVGEVLNMDDEFETFKFKVNDSDPEPENDNDESMEDVYVQQSIISQPQYSKDSYEKMVWQEKSEGKQTCSNLKKSQMTLVQDSYQTQRKTQCKPNSQDQSDQNSYIIQECSDSQDNQFIQPVLPKITKTKKQISKSILKNKNLDKQIKIQDNFQEKITQNVSQKIRKSERKKTVKIQFVQQQQYIQQNSNHQNIQLQEIKQQNLIQFEKGVYGHYKILSKQEKEYLVQISKKFGVSQTAKAYNISVNNICRWKKCCDRKIGAGRKISNYQLQNKMIDFVKNAIEDGKILTRKQIQDQAKNYSNDHNFKASKGWFERFAMRNKFLFQEADEA